MSRTLALLLALWPLVAGAKKSTLTVDAGEGEMHLVFDDAQVTEADLKAAAALAPQASPDGDNVPTIDTCAGGSAPGSPQFLAGAERCLEKGRAEVARVAAIAAPPELQPAIDYLKAQSTFFLALEEAKVAFLRDGARAALEKTIAGVDPKVACADALRAIGSDGEIGARYRAVSFKWHNCMNDAVGKKRGDYPSAPWKKFLKARGVRATIKYPSGD